jgi:hypothetical protein
MTLFFKKLICLSTLFVFTFSQKPAAYGQTDSIQNRKLNKVILYSGVTYGASILALSQIWYKDQGFTSFRFFDDNPEWNQVDKVGHFFSTYQFSRIADNVLQGAGLEEKKAAFWASVTGTGLLIPIELLDGFSPEFGFSYGDMIANAAGSAFFLGQDLLWNEQRIQPKFSFHRTALAQVSPHLLGSNFPEELIKDYNGQTYWLSFDIHAFAKHSNFPKWLNLAVGYGAQDMVRGRDFQNNAAGYDSYRQLYVGIDFDLSYIKTDKKWLKTALFILDAFKLPAPTLSFGRNNQQLHLLYF